MRASSRGGSAPSTKQERAQELRHHLGHLDALRGLAVLAVIWIHAGLVFYHRYYFQLNGAGVRGVQLFFVVSAFTLLLSAERRSAEPLPVLSFFLRRFFRLAPLCYPFIVLGFYSSPMLSGIGWLRTLPAFVFLQNLSPRTALAGAQNGWSLSVEALFYCCFPLLLRWVRDLRKAVLWLACSIPISVCIWFPMSRLHPGDFAYWTYYSFVVQAPVFLMGFVAFFLWRDHLRSSVGTPGAKWTSASLLVLTGIIYVNIVPIENYKTFFSSVFTVTLLLAVSLYPWPLLVNRVTIYLGKISYSMYLIQGLLFPGYSHFLLERYPSLLQHGRWEVVWCVGGFVVGTVAAAAIGSVTWYFIEEPGIRLGRRVVRYVQGKAQTGAGLLPPKGLILSETNTPDAQF